MSKRIARARLDSLGFKPRGLTAAEAAAYLNVSVATFRNRVKKGIIPGPIPGLNRWDKQTLDDWLSGTVVKVDPIMEAILGGKG